MKSCHETPDKGCQAREAPRAPANQGGKLGSYSDGPGQKGISDLETQLKGVSLSISVELC